MEYSLVAVHLSQSREPEYHEPHGELVFLPPWYKGRRRRVERSLEMARYTKAYHISVKATSLEMSMASMV